MTDAPSPEAPRERLATNEILARTFGVQRRGFRPDDVTRYLAQLAGYIAEQHAAIDKLTEERDSLRAELEGLKARRDLARLDVATVTSVLGEEAAEILRSASEAAEAIRARAEAYASEVTSRAETELATRRQELDTRQARMAEEHRTRMERADVEIEERAASRIAEAEEAARAKMDKATEDAGEIISKAKAVRTEVYDEVRARTAQAKAELGELEERRTRLAAVMQNAQAVIGQLSQDLAHPSAVPTFELVEHEPDSEPVVPEAAAARATEIPEALTDEVEGEQPPHRTLYYFSDLEEEPVAATEASAPEAQAYAEWEGAEAAEREGLPEVETTGAAIAETAEGGTPQVEPHGEPPVPLAEEESSEGSGAIEEGFAVSAPAPAAEGEEEPDRRQASVQGIFARLLSDVSPVDQAAAASAEPSAESTESPVASAADDTAAQVEPDEEPAPAYSIHDDYVQNFTGIQAQLARRVKRVLQDDQNELLDGLRTTRVRDTAGLIGGVPALAARYAEVMGVFVATVADASAGLYSRYAENVAGDANVLSIRVDPPAELSESVTELAEELAGEVHGRLDRVLSKHESEDEVSLASNIGAAFRELKTDYVELLAKDLVSSLTNSWLLYSTDVKAVRWQRGPEPGCSDCEDNELAGALASGSEFPTGILFPPAHIGCGCLLVPEFA
ncbi:MAG: DivIVA domain-containing protein [Actinomycetota bacterium]|nr:DivIVA domain-containing protein [Actinomycetota bacterium]